MSYGVSYTKKTYHKWYQSEKTKTPYEDWISRGMGPVIFKYCEHCNDDILKIYFNPYERLLYIHGDLDYYNYKVVCKLIINNNTIRIEQIFSKNINIWPEISGGLKTSCGGLSHYKANVNILRHHFSINFAIERFFGTTWNLIIPLTVPRISEESFEIAKKYQDDFNFYRTGPWDHTIGIYKLDKEAAAIIIQKYFRGWKVRMQYTYNPNTTLGRYYILKSFKTLIS